jgi:hypothetical protein
MKLPLQVDGSRWHFRYEEPELDEESGMARGKTVSFEFKTFEKVKGEYGRWAWGKLSRLTEIVNEYSSHEYKMGELLKAHRNLSKEGPVIAITFDEGERFHQADIDSIAQYLDYSPKNQYVPEEVYIPAGFCKNILHHYTGVKERNVGQRVEKILKKLETQLQRQRFCTFDYCDDDTEVAPQVTHILETKYRDYLTALSCPKEEEGSRCYRWIFYSPKDLEMAVVEYGKEYAAFQKHILHERDWREVSRDFLLEGNHVFYLRRRQGFDF